MSQRFVGALERFVQRQGIDLVMFEKGQRKDDVAQAYLATFKGDEGVLFVGKAQEKASVFRTEKRRDAQGKTYPWIIGSTAMVNHYSLTPQGSTAAHRGFDRLDAALATFLQEVTLAA